MAIIIPDKSSRTYHDVKGEDAHKKSAERQVCEWIEEHITDDMFGGRVVGGINRVVHGKEMDILLVIPNKGVLIIEVKAYDRSFVKIFNDDQMIEVNDPKEPVKKHPYNQARGYIYTLMHYFREEQEYVAKYGLCCFVPLVAMPNMSRQEYKELGLDMPFAMEGTMTKEWFESPAIFKTKFKKAVNYVFRTVKHTPFDTDYYALAVRKLQLTSAVRQLVDEAADCVQELPVVEAVQIPATEQLPTHEQVIWTPQKIADQFKVVSVQQCNQAPSTVVYSRRYIISGALGKERIVAMVKCMLEERQYGTKIVLLADGFDQPTQQAVLEQIATAQEMDQERGLLQKGRLFLFEKHDLQQATGRVYDPICCIDGHSVWTVQQAGTAQQKEVTCSDTALHEELIQTFSNKTETGYNDEQFTIEHADHTADVLVTAGAGTGKTFSMVGRIAYLIYINCLKPQKPIALADMIYMMTFTNNSTDEMRSRLFGHFQHYYLLTQQDCYMEILEQIGGMKIKTIDAMAKMLLAKYAHILGLSKNFKIKSGKYVKDHIIKRRVQAYLRAEGIDTTVEQGTNTFIEKYNLRSYQLESVVRKFIDYIGNRSIYLDGINCEIRAQAKDTPYFQEFLQTVVKECIDEYREHNIANNSLEMESVVTWLGESKEAIQDEYCKSVHDKQVNDTDVKRRYLFVDEFQDTDKNQISLIAFFAELYKLTLFVVGDRKQSIYGFRGAQDTAFDELKNVLNSRIVGKPYSLKKNYRTDGQLLTLFDKCFKESFPSNHFVYRSEDQLVPQCNVLPASTLEEELFCKITIEDGTLTKVGEGLEVALAALKERIRKYPTKGTGKTHTIAILTRTNTEKEMIRRLNAQYGWEVVFDAEGEFYRQDAVIDFYKLVTALLNPDSADYVYNLACTPYCMHPLTKGYFYFKEANSIQTLVDLDQVLATMYQPRDGQEEVPFSFTQCLEKVRTVTGLKLLRDLVSKNKPWERYVPESLQTVNQHVRSVEDTERLSAARMHYQKCLDQLFQTLIEANGTEYITLQQIASNLKLSIVTKQAMELYKDNEQDQMSENTEAVRIQVVCTTIHKSKGLEYRSVILPFTTRDIAKVSGNEIIVDHEENNVTWIEYNLKTKQPGDEYAKSYYKSKGFKDCLDKKKANQIAEELRILYVAMTRAEAEFYYLVSLEEQKDTEKHTWAKYLNGKEKIHENTNL